MAKQNIVVVGAGYAGVSATKYLAKKLKKEDVAITLIDRHSYHTMMTELHEVAGGRVEPEAINTICSICLLVKRMYNLSQTL